MNHFRLYFRFFTLHIQSMMQHKISFLLTALGQFLVSFNVFLGIYFMMSRFHQVEGYTYSQVLLCFSIMLMAFSLAETFFRGFDTFQNMISNGEFDRIMLQPRNNIFLVLCRKIELTRIGRLAQAAVMLCYAMPRSAVDWNARKICLLILMVLCGSAVFAGIYMVYAAFCFFTLDSLEFMNIFTDGAREYGKYPLVIYGKTVLTICTYIVPFALFQYYPFLYLIGKAQYDWYAVLPLVSLVFLIPCRIFWNYGVRHYQSTGS